MLIRRKTYNNMVDQIERLTNMYYEKDLEMASYRFDLIEIRNALQNRRLDTPDKKLNRIKKILRGKNENKVTKDN